MKGIVFTEFLELIEEVYGFEVVDSVIEECELPSGGSYTAVGSYDHQELLTMVTRLSEKTGAPIEDLVKTFGVHLFGRFLELYPNFFEGVKSGVDFLRNVEDYIHVEVRKLYPDAELPRFDYEENEGEGHTMIYESPRPFAALAEGLIDACLKHFGDDVKVERENREGRTEFRLTTP